MFKGARFLPGETAQAGAAERPRNALLGAMKESSCPMCDTHMTVTLVSRATVRKGRAAGRRCSLVAGANPAAISFQYDNDGLLTNAGALVLTPDP